MTGIGTAGVRRILAAVVTAGLVTPLLAQDPPRSDVGGAALFRTYCAACHGVGAKGEGPLAASLRRKPADLTTFARRHGGAYDAALDGRIIDGRAPVRDHGGKDMPVWGDAFSSALGSTGEATAIARVMELVRYLESVQVK